MSIPSATWMKAAVSLALGTALVQLLPSVIFSTVGYILLCVITSKVLFCLCSQFISKRMIDVSLNKAVLITGNVKHFHRAQWSLNYITETSSVRKLTDFRFQY